MAKVLIPIPRRDFDPTEAAVSWSVLKKLGHSVAFATPDGRPGRADDLMLTGEGLDFWGFVPGLEAHHGDRPADAGQRGRAAGLRGDGTGPRLQGAARVAAGLVAKTSTDCSFPAVIARAACANIWKAATCKNS